DVLKNSAAWDMLDFLAGWGAISATALEEHRSFSAKCDVFGHTAYSVRGVFEHGKLMGMTVVVLDSGAWFGFVPDADVKRVAATKGPQFTALYKQAGA